MKKRKKPVLKEQQAIGFGLTPSKTKLGKYIRKRRLKLNLRQIDLAKQVGLAQNILSYIEIGDGKYLTEKQVILFAKALKCEPEQLRKRMMVRPSSIPKTELAKLIILRRKELGLSIPEFAKRLGVSTEKARLMELSSVQHISYKRAKLLAKALELEPSTLTKFLGPSLDKAKGDFGRMIRKRRMEMGMGTVELAEKIGTPHQLISLVERGERGLSQSDDIIAKLAEILEIDIAELETIRPKKKLRKPRKADSLGGFLTSKRLESGLTQAQLGERANISATTVSFIETERYFPTHKMLDKFTKALSCQIPPGLMPPQPEPKSVRVVPKPKSRIRTLLGEFLRNKRLELGLKQWQVAEKVGSSSAMVSQFEHGKRIPKNRMLKKLSKALQCEIPKELMPRTTERSKNSKEPVPIALQKTTLGTFVASRREDLQLTQVQLAIRANTHPRVVAKLERGKYAPGGVMLEKFSKALQCEIPAQLVEEAREQLQSFSSKT